MSKTPESPDIAGTRIRFIQEHLPMHENSWGGSTLAFHVLNVVTQHDDPDFTAQLADAFVGTQASIFHNDEDLTEERGLIVEELVITADHVVVSYVEHAGDFPLFPPGAEYAAKLLHRFTIITGNEAEWAAFNATQVTVNP